MFKTKVRDICEMKERFIILRSLPQKQFVPQNYSLGLFKAFAEDGVCKDSCRIHLMQPFSMICENHMRENLD